MKKAFLLICILILAGCADPFSGRESEPPISDAGTYIQPVTPQIVLFNLEQSYKELLVSNYLLCLDSSFFFKYDFVVRQIDENDSGWLYMDEIRLTESLFNNRLADTMLSTSMALSVLAEQNDQAFDTMAILYRSYTITAIDNSNESNPDTSEYVGTSIFTMIENEQGLWSIIRWEDQHQNTNTPSWADYKNGYR
jgi:hypothetical protein